MQSILPRFNYSISNNINKYLPSNIFLISMNFKFLAWNLDDWFSTQGSVLKYDKLEHLILSMVGVLAFVYILKIEIFLSLALIFLLGISWEIRDGLVKNGQGFSRKDLIANFIGIIFAYYIFILF